MSKATEQAMNPEDFRALVKAMRAAQKAYFKSRDRSVLQEAQRIEREVDRALEAETGGLFDFEKGPL